MKKLIIQLLPAMLFCLFIQCRAQESMLSARDPHIHYMGRVIMQKNVAQLSWSATTVKIAFSGTGIKASLKDERGDNYLKVIVDGKVIKDLHPDTIQHTYTLVENLSAGKHTLELFKRTEWDRGKTWLYGFIPDAGTTLLAAPPAAKRKIEFFGNSITCGFGVMDTSGKDRGTSEFEDAYLSYATLTARHYHADVHLTAKSGIGVVVSWFPLIMPEMYDRADATDPSSKWDFGQYTPDVVVINLFQNDSWLLMHPDHEQFKARFGTQAPDSSQIITAYSDLVKKIRSQYPKATIICALGNMDASSKGMPWPGYIRSAVASLHDSKIYSLIFPYKNTPGHPHVAEQDAMSKQLISFIDQHVKW